MSKFVEMVKFAGANCELIQQESEILSKLESFEEFRNAKHVFSAIGSVPGNVQMSVTDEARHLEDLDFVIYPGQFAVLEHGACWLSDENLRHSVCYFITQFLVLVARSEQIVHNMHQVYRLAKSPMLGFGLFLSGPSKMADIEQSLVIGAHGCRELQVYVV